MAKKGRFDSLRQLKKQRQEEEPLSEVTEIQAEPSSLAEQKNDVTSREASKLDSPNNLSRRGRGRPRGRRSDPRYTQISAYIPLELLLEVQDELARERRIKQERTARPVSDLMEELLTDWLELRRSR